VRIAALLDSHPFSPQRGAERDEAFGLPARCSRKPVALSDALQQLEKRNPRRVRIIELRYIGGLWFEEAAVVLEISVRTAKRDWALARAWLFKETRGGPSQTHRQRRVRTMRPTEGRMRGGGLYWFFVSALGTPRLCPVTTLFGANYELCSRERCSAPLCGSRIGVRC
jgi:hypothetical protein